MYSFLHMKKTNKNGTKFWFIESTKTMSKAPKLKFVDAPEKITYGDWQGGEKVLCPRTKKGHTHNVNRYRIAISSITGKYIVFEVGQYIAKCDLDALPLILNYGWVYSGGSVKSSNDGTSFRRAVLDADLGDNIRHLNGDKLDFRKANLEKFVHKMYKPELDHVAPKVEVDIAEIVKAEEWMGGHPAGSVSRNVQGNSVRFRVKFFNADGSRPSKSFSVSAYESEEAALVAAREYQYNTSVERGDIKNRYRRVTTKDGKMYLEVQLSNADDTFLCDLQDIQLLHDHTWCLNDEGYVASGGNKLFHRFVMPGYDNIDHINRNKQDGRRVNLRDGANGVNARNRGIGKNNTSGTLGVSYNTRLDAWQAIWNEGGKPVTKTFGVNKHGEEKAKQLAIDAREAANERLQRQPI